MSQKPGLILEKISSTLVGDASKALKCCEIFKVMNDYYLVGVEPFLQQHSGVLDLSPDGKKRVERIKDALKGADFYCKKAQEYFSFFGVNFENPTKSRSIDVSKIDAESVSHLLYDSVQLLYVVLWEVFAEFLKPLEKLYHFRLCDAGLFPKKYPLFPYSIGTEQTEFDFLRLVGRSALFRLGETFPFELRVVYQASSYFQNCFDEGRKKTSATESKELIDDLIRLFSVRNYVCHIGRVITMQETTEDRMLSLLYDLSTLLPKIQDSCIGVINAFAELAQKEAVQN